MSPQLVDRAPFHGELETMPALETITLLRSSFRATKDGTRKQGANTSASFQYGIAKYTAPTAAQKKTTADPSIRARKPRLGVITISSDVGPCSAVSSRARRIIQRKITGATAAHTKPMTKLDTMIQPANAVGKPRTNSVAVCESGAQRART